MVPILRIYIGSIIIQIKNQIQNTRDQVLQQTKKILKDYLSDVDSKLTTAINDRQNALIEEKKNSQKNDEIIKEIDSLKKKRENIPHELKRINEILEEVAL